MPKFPRPNMSGYKPNLKSSDEGNGFDIGWIEGEFSDGRPYRAELWCWDSNAVITFFFSSLELENASDKEFADLLERETAFKEGARELIVPIKIQDFSGNELWAVNIFFDGDKPFLIPSGWGEFILYQEVRGDTGRHTHLPPEILHP